MAMSTEISATKIFEYTTVRQSTLDTLSQNALSNAITKYQDGNYDAAIKEFKRSIALSPQSENVIDAYEYLAQTYLKKEDYKNAEKSFQAALQLDNQREDIYLKLGNLYYYQEKYDQAEKAYRTAVRIYPTEESYYSLAQCCLNNGKLEEAEALFQKVIRLSPDSGDGRYGLGMTYSKQGRYEEAIEQFHEALEKEPDFDDARMELGYAYADMGDMEEAQKQYEILEDTGSSLANLLYLYMYKVEKPAFALAKPGNFNWNLSIKTPVKALDNYLKNAGETSYFTVSFQFNKEMDVRSVQNPLNWSIKRSDGTGASDYNFGLSIPDTEVDISACPKYVIYDPITQTAAVTFSVMQNENADGTIDPSHIVFSFSGTDAFGLTMNPKADQYSGFKGFA